MTPTDSAAYRQQELYWQQLVDLKVGCEYMRRYRNSLIRWETRIGVLRALASSGAIAAWAVVQAYPLVWGGIIAAAQVADAAKEVLPLSARRRAATELVAALDGQFIEALHEWEGVYGGSVELTDITDRRLKLMQRRLSAERKHFKPTGVPERRSLLLLANADANAYFKAMFGDLR